MLERIVGERYAPFFQRLQNRLKAVNCTLKIASEYCCSYDDQCWWYRIYDWTAESWQGGWGWRSHNLYQLAMSASQCASYIIKEAEKRDTRPL